MRGWQPAVKPLYARFNLAGRKFAVFKSRSNIRPELHDTPEWNNIPADKREHCTMDSKCRSEHCK